MAEFALPIDPRLPAIVQAVRQHRGAVVTAEPGAGKTTRVPRAILEAGEPGNILVLEPRRIAARASAERVASELGERVGGAIGYVTRFERAVGPSTRLTFVTEGILTRRLLSDPELEGVSTVVLDEIHERHIASDMALALLRRLQRTSRSDLALVAMSATIDADPIATFLDVPIVHSEGRVFEVTIEHATESDDRPLASQVSSGLFQLLEARASFEGHILVFLPGIREIRAAIEACRKHADRHDLELLPLSGSSSVEEQNRALYGNSGRRKVIFATNVAETSVTIAGVGAVVDSGLANVASCSPWSGLPMLKLSKISKASAAQRAGRAGRTRAGVALRLYTKGDLQSRPAFETPEIARVDLSEPVLELVAHGVTDPKAFAWFEVPPATSVATAVALLDNLGAVEASADAGGERRLAMTKIGARMLDFPIHPRQARILVEAEARGVAFDGCSIAALIGERTAQRTDPTAHRTSDRSDLFAMMDELDRAEDRFGAAARTRQQLRRAVKKDGKRPPEGKPYEDALLIATLAGYPDRVGRRKPADARGGRKSAEIVFAAGGSAVLADSSCVRESDLVVALDAEDRVEGASRRTTVRTASAVEADWLLDLFTDRITDEEVTSVVESSGRVETVRRMRFGNLVLEETRAPAVSGDAAERALAQFVGAKGLPLEAKEALERISVRIALARTSSRAFDTLALDPADSAAVIRAACEGKLTVPEVLATPFGALIENAFASDQRGLLARLAPERIDLPSGRSLAVRYASGSEPSVASRLQDFFGMAQGPRILGGAKPLLLELLAPNQRAVQITTDLAGFWEKHYPTIAKELRRKYPRHAWPEDPRHSQPPARRR